jgi:hypothetical protein
MISILYNVIINKYITVTPKFPINVYKNKNAVVAYEVCNRSFLPSPYVKVNFLPNENYAEDRTAKYITIISPKKTETIEHTFRGEIAGTSEIVGYIHTADFLLFGGKGIIKEGKKIHGGYSLPINIIYDIPEVAGNGMFLRSIGEQIQDTDEDSDSAAKSFISTYVPGYEHREYIPGDSLKKINWKLSARTDDIMVRLDEPINAIKPVIYIDFAKVPAISKYAEIMDEELMVEGCLACLRNSVKVGICANVCFYEHIVTPENTSEFIYRQYEISSITDVENLAVKLSSITFEPENTYRLLPSDVVKKRNLAVFTQQSSSIIARYENYAVENETNVSIVSTNNLSNLNSKIKTWVINADRTISSI